jgi:3-deoxy-D-manno-octulosonate 8-phosphate phosphatase (KDO 8-P phosphatase)
MGGATFLGFLYGVQNILKAMDAPHWGEMREANLILDFRENRVSFSAVVMFVYYAQLQIYSSAFWGDKVIITNRLTLLPFSMQLLEKLAQVKLLVFDLDGVLTNGKLLVMPNGEWIREMDIKDGYALQHAVKSGLKVAVITGSNSIPVKERLSKLGIEMFYENTSQKSLIINKLLIEFNFDKSAALFMGDDLPDLDAFGAVGIKTCPADAAPELLQKADYISPKPGGNGCVRDIIEKTLRTQGKWSAPNNIQSI